MRLKSGMNVKIYSADGRVVKAKVIRHDCQDYIRFGIRPYIPFTFPIFIDDIESIKQSPDDNYSYNIYLHPLSDNDGNCQAGKAIACYRYKLA